MNGVVLDPKTFLITGYQGATLVLMLVSGAQVRHVGAGVLKSPGLVALDSQHGDFVVSDSVLRELIVFGPDGSLRDTIPFRMHPTLLALGIVDGNTFIVREGVTPGAIDIERYNDLRNPPVRVVRVPTPQRLGSDSFWSVMSERKVTFSQLVYPFGSYTVDLVTATITRARPLSRVLAAKMSPDTLAWIGLPPIQLDQGALRTYADLKSDRRILALFDTGGTLVRTTDLNVPLGLIAGSPEFHRLVGAQYTVGTEAVLYDWRWERISPQHR
jgi:hypothetical protein